MCKRLTKCLTNYITDCSPSLFPPPFLSFPCRGEGPGHRLQYYSANRGRVSGEMKCCYERTADVRKEAEKEAYASNPEPKRWAVQSRYAPNPEVKKSMVKTRYNANRSGVLLRRRSHYYASRMCRRAARLLHHALHHSRENAKNKLYQTSKAS